MDYYGTLGPACLQEDILHRMVQAGMTGIRINLSHGGLAEHGDWIVLAHRVASEEGKKLQILIDLEGPELRAGSLPQPLTMNVGEIVPLQKLALPAQVCADLSAGDRILLDDGKLELEIMGSTENRIQQAPGEIPAETPEETQALVIRGGTLTSRKSVAVPGKIWDLPALTEHDRKNLALAPELGVTGVMLPFCRRASDIEQLKTALRDIGYGYSEEKGSSALRIFAKIENQEGAAHVRELAEAADEIVIARGDLGNSVPLWELPRQQKQISRVCRETGTPFMVVTQMLDSMHNRAVPTRAEVMDIYQAILDGASSVMLTGETAAGAYPAEAMEYLVRTGRIAEEDRRYH